MMMGNKGERSVLTRLVVTCFAFAILSIGSAPAGAQGSPAACIAAIESCPGGIASAEVTTNFIASLQQQVPPGTWGKPLSIGGYKVVFAKPGNNGDYWPPNAFDQFQPACTVPHEGLRKIITQSGTGACFVGIRLPSDQAKKQHPFSTKGQYVAPVTVVLEVQSKGGAREILVKLYNPLTANCGLAADFSAPVDVALTHAMTYRQATKAYLNPSEFAGLSGLQMPMPYQAGKIPIVLVHGLNSAPRTWENVINELQADPVIRERYQFWLFRYPTGQPVALSAMQLRESLNAARKFYDPNGKNKAFENMVIIGHSMGGMLTRLQVTESGNAFWDLIMTRGVDPNSLSEADREVLHRVLNFHPQPFVKRVIFCATPHRGSTLASGGVGQLAAKLVKSPIAVLNAASDMASPIAPRISVDLKNALGEIPTGVDNLSPRNPFVLLYQTQPIQVPCHSIIGTEGVYKNGKPLSDGVVPYWSAHLDCAKSEFWVPSGHDAHDHPNAIPEFDRILRLHLGM
ncbi:MAG: hypothetical protein K1X53_16665 [Candidatus Sumerlaeaceae bacterium]|nr:hypothetical protein [Candidatus Sumerlaeaceae bacterium]